MKAYATFDGSDDTIVRVQVLREPNDDSFARYLRKATEEFRRRERWGLLFDTGDLTYFPSRYREMQNDWLVRTEDEFSGKWIAAAFVIRHRVIRGALRAIYWLNRPYYKHGVFADRESAEAWLAEEMGTKKVGEG